MPLYLTRTSNLLLLVSERSPLHSLECEPAGAEPQDFACRWQSRLESKTRLERTLTVSHFTGHERGWKLVYGLSGDMDGRLLKKNVEYKVQVDTTSTKITFPGELILKWIIKIEIIKKPGPSNWV